MDRTERKPLDYILAEMLGVEQRLAYALVINIHEAFPQVNDRTKISLVNHRVMIPVAPPPEYPRPEKRLRLVRKPGYRWQLHRAFYEMMDLPAIAAWGWREEVYEVYPPIAPFRTRELPFQQIMVNPYFFRRDAADPFGSVWIYLVAYWPEKDTLFILPPR